MTPVLVVGIPVLGALAMAFTGWRVLWSVFAAVTTGALVISLVPPVLKGEQPEVTLTTVLPGVDLALRVDAAGMVLALSAAVLWILATSYTDGYLRAAEESHRTRFSIAFSLCMAAAMGLAFAANLFTFLVFYELLTLATYPLVVHKQTPTALAAGRRYLFTLLAGGTAVLLATVIVYRQAPGGEFVAGGILTEGTSDALVAFLVLLAVLGFGTKAAIMPLHGWLPRAMVAPTPVSALLHAVAVVKAGIFGFVRMFGYVIGPERMAEIGAGVLVASLAAITVVVSSLIAFGQDNIKARLAYSTIAHLSLIVLGLALASPSAWTGAMLHLANHAVLKITLFFVAGAIYVTAGIDRISEMDGLGRRMPLTMGAFGIAAVGLAGLPPMGGFVSKWFLGAGTIEAESPVLAVIMITSGLMTAGYLLPIVYRAFARAPVADSDAAHSGFSLRGEAPRSMLIPLCTTAVIGLALGFGDFTGLGRLSADAAAAILEVRP